MKAQQTAPAKAGKGRQKQEGNGQNMYVIAGLGNPKKEYDNTRHNIGFSVIDMLADKTGISVNTAKHKGLLGAGYLNGQKIILVKPLTYMNLSGECIREVLDYYKVDGSIEPDRDSRRYQPGAWHHPGAQKRQRGWS